MERAITEAKTKSVDSSLSYLSNKTEEIASAITEIESRLERVCSSPLEKVSECKEDRAQMECKFAEEITVLGDRLDGQLDRLRKILRTLEI